MIVAAFVVTCVSCPKSATTGGSPLAVGVFATIHSMVIPKSEEAEPQQQKPRPWHYKHPWLFVASLVVLLAGTEMFAIRKDRAAALQRFLAANDIPAIMHEVAAVTREKQDFVIVEMQDVQAAKAVYSPAGLRHVEIGKAFFNELGKWDAAFVLAHEAGHFVFGHVGHPPSTEAQQLQADSFAGFACYRLGATLEETLHILKRSDYPDPRMNARRIRAAAYGWWLAHVTDDRLLLGLAKSLP